MPLRARLGLAFVFSCALIAPAPSAVAVTTVPAFEVGSIDWNGGYGSPDLVVKYKTGVMGCCKVGWLAFDLSSIGFQVTGATLRLDFSAYSSYESTETLEIYDSDTPIEELLDPPTDIDGMAIPFWDLTQGVLYGAAVVSATDEGTVIEIPLDAALADINSALGGDFSLGLYVLEELGEDQDIYLTFDSLATEHELVLIPEPSTALLLALGLAGLAVRGRRLA